MALHNNDDMCDEAEDKDAESMFDDDLFWWYAIEEFKDDKASPLWVWVCVLVVIAVVFIVASCS